MKLKRHAFALPLLAGGLLTFYSCNSSSSAEKDGSNPLYSIEVPKVKIKDQTMQLTIEDASQAQHLELPSGSFIDIPANAFVDGNGNPVSGKVKLSFKEYHDAADIILGGIPMEYDTAGTQQVLQTAGMFNVQAFSGKEEIQIANGKSIQVSLLAKDDGADYNFYAFDEKAGNWVYTGKSVNKPAHHLKEDSTQTASVPREPIAPHKYDPNLPVIDMDIDVKEYPELASLRGLMWQYAGPDAAKEAAKNDWIFKHKWKKIAVEVLDPAASTFTLILTDGKSDFKTVITPVLGGKAFEKAMAQYQAQKAAYEEKYSKELKDKAANSKMVYRVFGITRTGTYNCDRIYYDDSTVTINASFITDDPEFGKKDSDKIFMVSGGMRTVYKFSKKDWGRLKYIARDQKALVAILSNGKIAVFSNQDFLTKVTPEIVSSGKYTFDLKTVQADDIDPEILRKMIEG